VKLVAFVALAIITYTALTSFVPVLTPIVTLWCTWETAICISRLIVPMISACICSAGLTQSEVV
jgi:hypothetical protein